MTQEAYDAVQAARAKIAAGVEQTIELDCPPGNPRPDDLIGGVIEGLLPSRDPVSKWFGNWKWDYTDVDPDRWQLIRQKVKVRIVALYAQGKIRYGSW